MGVPGWVRVAEESMWVSGSRVLHCCELKSISIFAWLSMRTVDCMPLGVTACTV